MRNDFEETISFTTAHCEQAFAEREKQQQLDFSNALDTARKDRDTAYEAGKVDGCRLGKAEGEKAAEDMILNTLVDRRINRNRKILSAFDIAIVILLILALMLFLSKWIRPSGILNNENSICKFINENSLSLAILSAILTSIIYMIKQIVKRHNWISLDSEVIKDRLRKITKK